MATGCDMRHNDSVKLLKQFSRQSSDGECSVEEELELLQNVYLQEELELVSSQKGHVVLKFHVTPSTADDKTQQFVYMDIIVSLSHEYPIAIPKVAFKESRGLSDAHLQSISDGVRHMSLEHQGSPMIYDLVEFVKDCLTDNNRPCGQCAICQINFQEDDEFVRTDCYHYYHPPCLSRYVKFCEQQRREEDEEQRRTGQNRWSAGSKPKSLECPVCRAPITTFLSPCIEEEEKECPSSVELSPELIKWQKEMALLYEKQLAKGGIVNTQEQDDTIDETWVSIRKENEETDKLICDEKKTKEKRSSLAAGNHRRSHSRQKRHHKGSSQGSDSPHQTRNGQIDKRRNGGSGREARGRPRQDAQELVGDDTKREEHSDSNDRKPSPLQLDRVKVQPITHSDQDKKTRTHQNASVHQQSWTVDSSSASPAAQRPSRAEDRLECKNTKDCRRTNIVINVGSRPRQTSAHSKREHV